MLLATVLLLGLAGHVWYLLHECPIDLSGDEAHYWDWSRRLDWSYYSKGPLVAWIIRGSCALLGDSAFAVRLPALLLAVGTSLLTYWLASRLFLSERIALGAVLLNHLVPMFIAGSVMMTIDPPLFFCWALATCSAASALFDSRRWSWIVMGAAVGLGFLAKYAMLFWLPGLLIFLSIDHRARRHLRCAWLWSGLGVALLFTLPVVIWNHRHGWVSFHHVARQTGAGEAGTFSLLNVAEFVGSQLAAVGPPVAVILVAATVYALGRRGRADPFTRPMCFLVAMGVPFFAIVLLDSLRTKIQANWPAPAYFSLMILGTYFLATRLAATESWRRWRGWFWGTVALGVICIPVLHNTEILYRPVQRIGWLFSRQPSKTWAPRRWDPTVKLRGWGELGQSVSNLLPEGGFVLCERYDVAALMAFYVRGQPRTYYVGSYFADPERRGRYTQYDLWPDRRLDHPALLGRGALYIGYPQSEQTPDLAPVDVAAAFERMERLPDLDIRRRDLKIRTFQIWRGQGFRGMHRPPGEGKF